MVGPKSAVFFRVPSLVKGKKSEERQNSFEEYYYDKEKKRVRERARAHTHMRKYR